MSFLKIQNLTVSSRLSPSVNKGKLSFKKESASANINPTELQAASKHFMRPRESEKLLSAWFLAPRKTFDFLPIRYF